MYTIIAIKVYKNHSTTYLKKYFEIFGRQMTVFKDKLDLGRSSSLTEEYKNLGFG